MILGWQVRISEANQPHPATGCMFPINDGVTDVNCLVNMALAMIQDFEQGVRRRFWASCVFGGHHLGKVVLELKYLQDGYHGVGAVGGDGQLVSRLGCF